MNGGDVAGFIIVGFLVGFTLMGCIAAIHWPRFPQTRPPHKVVFLSTTRTDGDPRFILADLKTEIEKRTDTTCIIMPRGASAEKIQ